MRFVVIISLLQLLMIPSYGQRLSAWDHGNDEIKESVTLPILYPTTFTRERELFNYNPRFFAQKISFMPDNTPVMRFGVQGKMGNHCSQYLGKYAGPNNFIQYLGKDGKWYTTDSHVQAVKSYLKMSKNTELKVYSGERECDMVEFDDAGNAYTIVRADLNGKMKSYFLCSIDCMKSWQVIPLERGGNFRIEADGFHNDRKNPPVIINKIKTGIQLFIPKLSRKGKITLKGPIMLAKEPKSQYHGVMAGAGNASITVGGRTYVVYMVNEERNGVKGVPHYIVSYDHKTGEVSKPLFLGESGHRLDGHNSPVIACDSHGYLHVLLGTHWHSMVYLKSEKPFNSQSWEAPQYVEGNGNNQWSRNGITYPGFVIDHENTIHLVVRGRNAVFKKEDTADPADNKDWQDILDYAMVYVRKREGGDWENRKDLVTPKHKDYSNWYHKISVDRKGNVYVAYLYYAHNLNEKEDEAYDRRWPNETVKDGIVKSKYSAHDPVLIHSVDGGDTWKITQTPDLEQSINKE
ncbi:hypothetical protein EYV94_21090 [Puteibacter caeruleilacunae]|nr:hypothetical protein EYV94_21090 [Puteibacter caeruleilacunae]